MTNPPAVQNVTVRYAQLQALSSGLSTVGAPALNVYQYDAKLPSSWQWNGGVQMMLPWSTSLDVAYTGQHSWNTPQAVNINAVDFGAAFLPQNQDPTLAASTTPGASALVTDLMRGYLGFGSITRRMSTLLADVPRDQPVVPAPLHQRRWRSDSSTRSPSTTIRTATRGCSTRGWLVLVSAPIRPKRMRCSRPIRSSTR